MRRILLAVAILTFSSSVFAQKIKVRRVKGNQAVVDFVGTPLQTGQVYDLMAQDDLGGESGFSGSGGRQYSFGLNFSYFSTKSDAAGSRNTTEAELGARFGWNFGSFEVGPLFAYESSDAGGFNATFIKAGGFGDFNIIQNIPGEAFLYGVGGYLALGQRDNGAGTKSSVTDVFVGPFAKWFPGGSSYAIRIDAGYEYMRLAQDSGDTTLTGIGLLGGLQVYF
ncbi:hypothetical protein [Bdellovibrio sp. HCB2-146]|uniref:hypothetical protein n=1 Tax=Bdellovibrio sp. HCB2-146 TaxID=3394362 RepID=UPI0039BD8352